MKQCRQGDLYLLILYTTDAIFKFDIIILQTILLKHIKHYVSAHQHTEEPNEGYEP